MSDLTNYKLPKYVEELFEQNCYFEYQEDLYFYQYIFATFDKNNQLPKDIEKQTELAIGLIKFHHEIFAFIDSIRYDYNSINFDIDELPLSLIINFYYYKDINKKVQTLKTGELGFPYFLHENDSFDSCPHCLDDEIPDCLGYIIHDTETLEDLDFQFDCEGFINHCYYDTGLINLLGENFSSMDLFFLLMIFYYNYDSLADYYEENDTEYDDIIVGVGDYQDYLQIIESKMIYSDIVSDPMYYFEYGFVHETIEGMI